MSFLALKPVLVFLALLTALLVSTRGTDAQSNIPVIRQVVGNDQTKIEGDNLLGGQQALRELAIDIYHANGTLLRAYTMGDIAAYGGEKMLALRIGAVPPNFDGTVVVRNRWGTSNRFPFKSGSPVCPHNGAIMGAYANTIWEDWIQEGPGVFRYDPPHSDQPPSPIFVPFFGQMVSMDGSVGTPGTYMLVRSAVFTCSQPPIVSGLETRGFNQTHIVGRNLRGYVQDDKDILAQLYDRNGQLFRTYRSQDFVAGTPEVMVFRVGVVPPDFMGTLVYSNGWGKSPPMPVFTGPYICPATVDQMAALTHTSMLDWVHIGPNNWAFNWKSPPRQSKTPIFVPFFGRLFGHEGERLRGLGETLQQQSARFECGP